MSKKEKDVVVQLRRRIRRVHPVENVTKKEKSDIDTFNEDVGNHAKNTCMFGISPIHAVDYTAFCLFLFLYLLFNIIYWLQYLRE